MQTAANRANAIFADREEANQAVPGPVLVPAPVPVSVPGPVLVPAHETVSVMDKNRVNDWAAETTWEGDNYNGQNRNPVNYGDRTAGNHIRGITRL